MARFDKVVQVVRGKAGTVFPSDGSAYSVRVGTGGSIVLSNGGTCHGVVVTNPNRAAYGTALAAGERIDMMRIGEIVEFAQAAGSPGSAIYAKAGGSFSMDPADGVQVGTLMEGGKRLVVGM